MDEQKLRELLDKIFTFVTARVYEDHVKQFLTPLFYVVNVEIDKLGMYKLVQYLKDNGFDFLFKQQEQEQEQTIKQQINPEDKIMHEFEKIDLDQEE